MLFSLDNDVLAALCIMNKDKLELKIDNVFFLSSKTILQIKPTKYNVVLAVRVSHFILFYLKEFKTNIISNSHHCHDQ